MNSKVLISLVNLKFYDTQDAARRSLEGMFKGKKDILASFDSGSGRGSGGGGKKVTGGGPTDLPSSSASTVRPGMDRASSSAASLHLGGISGTPPEASARGKTDDDDDEDVPLGILQAHGFPSSSRPPTRQPFTE